ncbi:MULTISPECIES: SGM_5486 family transporter-associated protein [unclassified Streptomyces]|nr:SGM_5486 family transporter-associated protein [Streptomyces sp. NBC_01716]
MPVLDPHPQNGQKKLLMMFGTIIGIMVVIAVIASIAAP